MRGEGIQRQIRSIPTSDAKRDFPLPSWGEGRVRGERGASAARRNNESE
jgi:hypothetical protein